jgi:hypothetical protein
LSIKNSAAVAFPGFDTDLYPGDAHMRTWKAASPYTFVAYYLKAPCHLNGSWTGRRAALVQMGWNLLPVYVGQQVVGVSPCRSSILCSSQGEVDGADAVAKMKSEGFSAGSYVYLDMERADTFSSPLSDYSKHWILRVVNGGYQPGIYCHIHNSPDVFSMAMQVCELLPAIVPRFWIVGGVTSHFNIGSSQPSDVGAAFANLWQRPESVLRTFGGVAIDIDESVSQWANPAV